LPGEDRPQEDTENLTQEFAVHHQPIPKYPRNRQDPLTIRCFREKLIPQVRSHLAHPTGQAARTHLRFAGKRDQALASTVTATDPGEAVAEHSAGEILAKRRFDESWIAFAITRPALVEKGLQVLPHHLMESRRLGIPLPVCAGENPARRNLDTSPLR
jgi:hypothetical protein